MAAKAAESINNNSKYVRVYGKVKELATEVLISIGIPELLGEIEKWKTLYKNQLDAEKYWDQQTKKVILWTMEAPSSMAAIEKLTEEVEALKNQLTKLEQERNEAQASNKILRKELQEMAESFKEHGNGNFNSTVTAIEELLSEV
ncbi:MAG TPA: hypothetical protein PLP33_27210 [Leptospiraceae bacterium]|nr:hypothetical protein [Leptospiraceae bacterium]